MKIFASVLLLILTLLTAIYPKCYADIKLTQICNNLNKSIYSPTHIYELRDRTHDGYHDLVNNIIYDKIYSSESIYDTRLNNYLFYCYNDYTVKGIVYSVGPNTDIETTKVGYVLNTKIIDNTNKSVEKAACALLDGFNELNSERATLIHYFVDNFFENDLTQDTLYIPTNSNGEYCITITDDDDYKITNRISIIVNDYRHRTDQYGKPNLQIIHSSVNYNYIYISGGSSGRGMYLDASSLVRNNDDITGIVLDMYRSDITGSSIYSFKKDLSSQYNEYLLYVDNIFKCKIRPDFRNSAFYVKLFWLMKSL